MYDFVKIKGADKKISSSSGDVITLKDFLEIYTPEIVRYIFAGTRPNKELSIAFDGDVIIANQLIESSSFYADPVFGSG